MMMVWNQNKHIFKETFPPGEGFGMRRSTQKTQGELTGRMVSSDRPMVTTERDAPSAAARTPRLAAMARERPAAAVLRLAARSDMVENMGRNGSGTTDGWTERPILQFSRGSLKANLHFFSP